MSWAERLEALRENQKLPSCQPTKPTNPESVSFGSEQDGHFEKILALVRCRDCQNFTPDPINPPGGIGCCRVDAAGDRPPWPNAPRRCTQFAITRPGVFRIAKTACKGTSVDPSMLTDWLIKQSDPDWLTPPAVKRWAQMIEQRGGFPE